MNFGRFLNSHLTATWDAFVMHFGLLQKGGDAVYPEKPP